MILVTGGTGLVGSHLLYKLTTEGHMIRAIYRSESSLKNVENIFRYYTAKPLDALSKIEWIKADITNIPDLNEAFANITKVYHCAALVSFQPKDYNQLRNVNIDGTANVVNLCISHKVKKLCHVSSIATIGEVNNPSNMRNEQSEWNPELNHSGYAITKYGAEMEVWRGSQEGLKTVIVNPGVIIGPGFWNLGSGALFKRVYRQKDIFITNGVTGFVSVNDVVNAMMLAMNSAIQNERFILVSENLSFYAIFKQIANALNVKYPKKIASKSMLNAICAIDYFKSLLIKSPRQLTKQVIKSITTVDYFDSSKIKNTLDFKFTPIDKAIKSTANFFN